MAARMKTINIACQLCGKPVRYLPEILCRRQKSVAKNSTTKWESVIGLEVHAQISSESKLFSGSATKFDGPINSQVSLFDAAIPGTLPVLNKRCVEAGVLTGLALKSEINNVSKFDRKHYFYSDLPTGYQITQQREPLAVGGELDYIVFDPSVSKHPFGKTARLVQIQLEQDSGKSLHDEEENKSLIDLNRAGMALMEIVTSPDFSTGEEAAGFVKELQKLLQTIGTCDGKMSEGSLRVDANISVNRIGHGLGTRTEVKNLNSIRHMVKAIEYEIKRQIKELEQGKQITMETRNFDVESGKTIAMRDKEKVLDYRFMPEPNLPPLHVYNSHTLPDSISADRVVMIDKLESKLPEFPGQKRERLKHKYNLPLTTIATLVIGEDLLEYFEEIMKCDGMDADIVANILVNDVLGLLNSEEITISQSKISVDDFKELYDVLQTKEISRKSASKVLEIMIVDPSRKPKVIIQEENLYQIIDPDIIVSLCQKVINDNPKLVGQSKRGKASAHQSLYKRVIKESRNLGNIKLVKDTLEKLLKDESNSN